MADDALGLQCLKTPVKRRRRALRLANIFANRKLYFTHDAAEAYRLPQGLKPPIKPAAQPAPKAAKPRAKP
jgi:hypothetical protein